MAIFWKTLDSKTVGQYINPEIAYTTQFWGDFNNEFAGKRLNDSFSIYLYRPITRGFRTEILAKGVVSISNKQLVIKVNYEIPIWSIIMFVVLAGLLSVQFVVALPLVGAIALIAGMLLIYGAIIMANYRDIKRIFERELISLKKGTE